MTQYTKSLNLDAVSGCLLAGFLFVLFSTRVLALGTPAGSDEAKNKATWPALFGVEESRRRCAELLQSAIGALEGFGDCAAALRFLATYIVERRK